MLKLLLNEVAQDKKRKKNRANHVFPHKEAEITVFVSRGSFLPRGAAPICSVLGHTPETQKEFNDMH